MMELLDRFAWRSIAQMRFIGCLLTALLTTIVLPQEALGSTTVTICKQTIPSPDPSGTSFTITGANSWTPPPPLPANDFTSLYPPNPFPLKNTQCRSFNTTNHDQYNQFTETVPPGWVLTNISCIYTTSVVHVLLSSDTVTIDQNEPSVTCTFVNQTSKPHGATLSVIKTFVDATGSPIAMPPLSFIVTASCTTVPYGPASVTLVTPPTATTSSSAPSTLTNVPVGDHCTFAETLPPMPPQAVKACHSNIFMGTPVWTTSYSPTPPLAIAAGSNVENITNRLRCSHHPFKP